MEFSYEITARIELVALGLQTSQVLRLVIDGDFEFFDLLFIVRLQSLRHRLKNCCRCFFQETPMMANKFRSRFIFTTANLL